MLTFPENRHKSSQFICRVAWKSFKSHTSHGTPTSSCFEQTCDTYLWLRTSSQIPYMGWGNSSMLLAYLYFIHAFSGLSTNSNNNIMPHTIINYTNKHSWAEFKSTVSSPSQLLNSHLYKSAAN